MSRRAFTLVELLVVLAIIALLVALIFPVLFRAREQGRKVTCSSNVRQLAQAWVMYAQDWDERTPGGAYTRFADRYTGRSPDGKRYTALWGCCRMCAVRGYSCVRRSWAGTSAPRTCLGHPPSASGQLHLQLRGDRCVAGGGDAGIGVNRVCG